METIEVKAARVQHARLIHALSQLSQRERRILEMRYGRDGEPTRTLAEVGKTFAITKEAVRQIENIALGKLRDHVNADSRHYTPGTR